MKTVEELRRRIEDFGTSGDPEELERERRNLLDLVEQMSQKAEVVQEEHQIIDECLEGLMALATLNFDCKLEPRGDERLAALALGINMLSEELQSSTVSFDFVKSILDSMAESLLVVDRHGRIRLVNQATQEMIGKTQEAMVGEHVECLGGLTRNHVAAVLSVLADGSPHQQLTTYRDSEGRETPIALSLRALAKHPGREQLFVWVGRDMRARLRHEHELREARDAAVASAVAKSEFLANMSHEIRTPLNGIMGMLELLLGTKLSDAQQDMAKTSASSADALLSVINDILDFSKIEAGKLSFDNTVFEFGGLIEDCARILGLRAEQQGLELTAVFLSADPLWVRSDPGRLRQIIINLLTNAIKFTHRGEVLVSATLVASDDTEATIRVSVKDTGIGIPKHRLGALFNAFVQADSSTTRKYGGTGLGLTICKSLVEMFHGTIDVVSEPGQGSEFSFTARLERAAPPKPARRIQTDALAGMRLLIVDDNVTNRRILDFHAQSWEMHSQVAEHGRAALAELRRAAAQGSPYQLMISDMHMPEMDGAHLISTVEADPNIPTPEILILTSIGSRDNPANTLQTYRYLTKPVKKSELRDELLRLLSESGQATPKTQVTKVATQEDRESVVLVAEDNLVNLKVVQALLTRIGIRSHGVGTGVAAIEALRQNSFSLVFMDCHMPEMDGYEATRQIRQNEHTTYLPIVALTASALLEERQRCLKAGMDDHLPKPLTIKSLSQVVNRWLVGAEPAKQRPHLGPLGSERPRSEASSIYTQASYELVADLWQKTMDASIELRDALAERNLQQVAGHARALASRLSGPHVAPVVAITRRLGQQAASGERIATISELHKLEHEAHLMLSYLSSDDCVSSGRT